MVLDWPDYKSVWICLDAREVQGGRLKICWASVRVGSNPTSGTYVPVAKWTRRRFPEPKTVGSSPIWDVGFFWPWRIFWHSASSCSSYRKNNNSSSLEVEHRSYEPEVAGSIPAWSILSACSVMVIIDASQALDPGSIPGRRTRAFYNQNDFLSLCYQFPGFS